MLLCPQPLGFLCAIVIKMTQAVSTIHRLNTVSGAGFKDPSDEIPFGGSNRSNFSSKWKDEIINPMSFIKSLVHLLKNIWMYIYISFIWCIFKYKLNTDPVYNVQVLFAQRKPYSSLQHNISLKNTGTRSFANMLLYLEVPTDLRLLIGRFVADSEANKSGSGTYFDIFHSSKRTRVQQCRLLLMTGGSCAGDRAIFYPWDMAAKTGNGCYWWRTTVRGWSWSSLCRYASPHVPCGLDRWRATNAGGRRQGPVPNCHHQTTADFQKTCLALSTGWIHPTYALSSFNENSVASWLACHCGHGSNVSAGGHRFRSSLESYRDVGASWMLGYPRACMSWLHTTLGWAHTWRCVTNAKQHWCYYCGRRGQSHHTSPHGAHLCCPWLCARVVAMGAGTWYIERSRGSWSSFVGAHAPYQHTYTGSQLHKRSGCEIPSSEQTSGRSMDCWYTLLRRTWRPGGWVSVGHLEETLQRVYACHRRGPLLCHWTIVTGLNWYPQRRQLGPCDVCKKWRQRSVTNWFHLSRSPTN